MLNILALIGSVGIAATLAVPVTALVMSIGLHGLALIGLCVGFLSLFPLS